ncbi:MAG: hypothetical protein ISS78_07175 [Phycisphaerae bacterium]|nr:hypothetical protein [Phycisphaerae bacterium]
MKRKRISTVAMIALAAFLFMGHTARASSVLMVNVHGTHYDGDGWNIRNTLVNAGATTTYVNLSSEGQVEAALQGGSFDQVWVFDLSAGTDDYGDDYAAIADWYNNRPSNELICDSRMISSYWNGRWTGEGQALTENYYHNIDVRGGGLVLGTDHSAYQTGINEINAQIGLNPFHSDFHLANIPVDTQNPLMVLPNDLGAHLSDDSSPGQTPYALQPNGQILYTVAWHSNNHDTPGIASTIEGAIGMHVDIATPPDQSVFQHTDTISLSATTTGGDGPFTFDWSHDGVPLGSGQSIQVPASTFPVGTSTITVLAQDAFFRTDSDSIQITIDSPPAMMIPEPLTMLAVGLGVTGLGGYIRKRRTT